ncbi:MAG: prolipoprotein diacylglyceryl transferase [Desulfobulbaceae bacterium]|nr:prolipoprotein diacylglyceryl transferase [Desulfobulbaceae bacterium]
MIAYPHIDPVIFSLGPLQVRWYGLMYVLGFLAAWKLVLYQARRFGWSLLIEHMDNLNMTLIIGVMLGGRLGYVVFYNLSYYLEHPIETLYTWHGGMSFHGGCIGVLTGGLIYCFRHKINFWKAADIYAATIPIGLGLGRLGNFINGELFGRVTEVGWGMIFPDGGPLPRHPSQLYEAFLEGMVLFTILWMVKDKPWRKKSPCWPHGSLLALFLIGYGCLRSFVELFREPDQHLGFIFSHLTMGQLLSFTMVAVGLVLWLLRIKSSGAQKVTA